jgi:RecB family exonuclease
MCSTFMDCPSKFYLRYVLGLRPRRKDPKKDGALDWGTCWHEAMFSFMDTPGTEDVRLVAGLEAIDLYYPSYLTPDVDNVKRSKHRLIEQYFAYTEKWLRREGEFETLRNEQYFDVYDAEVDLRWCGRIDSVRRIVRNGKIRVWDYKTTKAMGPQYFDQFEMSFQFPGYVWAVQHMMTEPVWEITVDVMYTVSKSFEFFERTFRYDAFRLREWEQNCKRITDRMRYMLEHHLYEPNAWDKNWQDCTRYGRCRFFNVHSLNPRGEGRLLELRDDYVVERWDPSSVVEVTKTNG